MIYTSLDGKKLSIEYDPRGDVLTIDGTLYAADLFRHLGDGREAFEPGTVVLIDKIESDGAVILTQLRSVGEFVAAIEDGRIE